MEHTIIWGFRKMVLIRRRLVQGDPARVTGSSLHVGYTRCAEWSGLIVSKTGSISARGEPFSSVPVHHVICFIIITQELAIQLLHGLFLILFIIVIFLVFLENVMDRGGEKE